MAGLRRRARFCFTLIELLVVIAIISVLCAMLTPALGSARDKTRDIKCGQNMRQIQMAVVMYANDHNNIYMGVNESLNAENYEYIGNNENEANYSTMNYNYNPHSTYYSFPQTSNQTPHTSTRSNNAGVTTNATSHGCIVIIIKPDINLEKLLSFIREC